MDQLSFSDAEHNTKRKRTSREIFLKEMDCAVPWAQLESIIEPFYPKAGNGRRPYPLSTMLRMHCLQQWYCLSNPTMEEELHEIFSMRQFTGLSLSRGSIPDETTTLNFRHLLERHDLARQILELVTVYLQEKGLMLRQGTIMDATIIAAPSSTKNKEGKGRTSIPGYQMPIWIHESPLSWFGQKRLPTCNVVCAIEPVSVEA